MGNAPVAKGYGPDCVESFESRQVCNCEVAVRLSLEGATPGRAVILAGGGSSVAEAVCTETLTQEQVLGVWAYAEADTASTPSSLDLSAFSGATLYVEAYAEDGSVASYGFFEITESSTNATATLE